MTKGALGLYDSGIGGKTILKEIRKLFPKIKIHYLADTKHLPLGNKSKAEIRKITKKGVEFLFNKDCSIVILVCNTASVNSIKFLQKNWIKKNYPNKKLLGVSIPLIELLNEKYKKFKNKKGIILSTPATHKTKVYQNKLSDLGFKNLISVPSYDLASDIEYGSNQKIISQLHKIQRYFNHSNDCNYIILACTHYPIALKQFKKVFPKSIIFIDPSNTIAKKFKEYLKKHKEIKLIKGKTHFWNS